MSETKVELKDKTTGFYDAETGFQVRREEQVSLGKQVGKRTMEAITNGRLLEVRVSKEVKEAETKRAEAEAARVAAEEAEAKRLADLKAKGK